MTYMDDLAEAIQRELPPHLVPDTDTMALFRTYAVLAMAKGERVVREDVHDAWSAWMSGHNPKHPSLKPIGELDRVTQLEDQPYVDAIHTVARTRNIGR